MMLMLFTSLSGVIGRRYSVSADLSAPPFARAYALYSTTNGNAKTDGANSTVNGYLIFILYSVVFLARAYYLTFESWLFP
jgi:chitin synthase